MSAINQLSRSDVLEAGDLVPAYIQEKGDPRAVPLSVFLEFIEQNISVNRLRSTYFTPPFAPGFAVSLEPNMHMIFTPATNFSSGEITLPQAPNDRDEVLFTTTMGTGTLTFVPGAGKSVSGAPASMTGGQFFRLKYDAVLSTWYRVG